MCKYKYGKVEFLKVFMDTKYVDFYVLVNQRKRVLIYVVFKGIFSQEQNL